MVNATVLKLRMGSYVPQYISVSMKNKILKKKADFGGTKVKNLRMGMGS